jgi:hypothetical protein
MEVSAFLQHRSLLCAQIVVIVTTDYQSMGSCADAEPSCFGGREQKNGLAVFSRMVSVITG